MNCRYICVGKCPELDMDNEPHCKCKDPKTVFEQYPDGCPCGNTPKWVPIIPEPRTVSQCISSDYCKGWNDAVNEASGVIEHQKAELEMMRNYIHDHNLEWDLLSYSKRKDSEQK